MKNKLMTVLTGVAASVALTTAAQAQSSSDALLNKLVEKGILSAQEAADLKDEALTNNAGATKFKVSNAIKSMELFGDLRMRYEYRAAQLGSETVNAGVVDAADRWRYALRIGLRGELADDYYYGLRFETSPNPRSTWNTLGNGGGGNFTYGGPFSKANNYSLFVGEAYLGWRPTSWLDVSFGRVPQPLYTTAMMWDSDFTPEGAVERLKFTAGPADLFATFGQYIYQDVSPGSATGILGGLVPDSDNNAYMMAWQLGATYHFNSNMSAKLAPVLYNYVGHGTGANGFYGSFVGQGQPNGFTFSNPALGGSSLPGSVAGSFNQTGINNLFIFELPGELNFKLGSLDARLFGDLGINFEGDQRARTAFNAAPGGFPAGVQLDQDKAYQVGLAVGNNLGLVYGSTPRKGTWEARVYWQHIEQYALDPNLLDSDFFEGRGNLQGIYAAFAYSLSDAMIGTLRYGSAERIDQNLGTGGFNADLPLPNPVNRFQIVQVDVTWKF